MNARVSSSTETNSKVTKIQRLKSLKNVTSSHDAIVSAMKDHGVELNPAMDDLLVSVLKITEYAKIETIDIDIGANGSINFKIDITNEMADDEKVLEILNHSSVAEMAELLRGAAGSKSQVSVVHNIPGSEAEQEQTAGAIGTEAWRKKNNITNQTDLPLDNKKVTIEETTTTTTTTQSTVNENVNDSETTSSTNQTTPETKKPGTIQIGVTVEPEATVKDMVTSGVSLVTGGALVIGAGIFAIVRAFNN